MKLLFANKDKMLKGIKLISALIGILATFIAIILGVLALKDKICSPEPPVPPAPTEFTGKLWDLNWIAYEPVNFDPERDIYPTEDEIAKDLEVLRSVKLNGIITFDSKKTLATIPRLARLKGFEGVIMGIHDPTDKQAINLAIREAEHVDGYCIGHNHLGVKKGYNLETLRKTMQYVRKKTIKPVSTTEYLVNYNEIADYVNWLFPDAGGTWRKTSNDSGTKTPDMLFDKFKGYVKDAKTLADRYNKVVFLKMISFPSGGHPGYTEDAQDRFFQKVLSYQGSDIDFPRSVSLSFFSAFDIAWKTRDKGFDLCEQHVGIFKRDSLPKRAANQFKIIYHYKGKH